MKRVILLGALVALTACGERSTLPPVTALSPVGANDIGAGYSPDGSRIYWWSRAGEFWQLWVSPADMSAPTKVPLRTRNTNVLLWSPDGSRFAVGINAETALPRVYIVDAAEGTARRLSTSDGYEYPVQWHPDSKRLTYLIPENTTAVMMIVNVDSGGPTRLVPGESRSNFGAYWSPDGTKLAVGIFDGGQTTIWLADSAGRNLRQLTTEGFENLAGGQTPWSPDGTAILYVSRRTGAGDIWLAPVDGSAPRQLTNDVRNDDNPIWSPDGKWIAFASERGLQTDLWVMPTAGGPAQRITDDVARETLVGWRPGTSQVVYTTGRTLRTLWAHALADGAERQLTPDSLEVDWFNLSADGQVEVTFNRGGGVFDFTAVPLAGGEPRTILRNAGGAGAYWSPDGARLAFGSNRGGSPDIWVVDAAGGTPRQLTNWPGQELAPVWSTDGSALYFFSDRDAEWGDIWRVPATGGEPERVTTLGRFLNLCGQVRSSSTLLGGTLGAGPGLFELARIRQDGSVRVVWNATTANCGQGSPTADSLFSVVGAAGGGLVGMLLPIDGGPGRRLLPAGSYPETWSPDGKQIVYSFQDGNATDYGILTLADGSTRRVTTTMEEEAGVEWSADGSTLVFRRSVPVSRITVADLAKVVD